MARGYVVDYNHYLADRAGQLPAASAGMTWVKPITLNKRNPRDNKA